MAVELKSGDTAPVFRGTCLDFEGKAVNLENATIQFVMTTKADPNVAVIDAPGVVLQVADGSDGSKGKVEYSWAAGDTDTPGEFLAGVKATFSDGSVQTFPTKGYTPVTIHDSLGPA